MVRKSWRLPSRPGSQWHAVARDLFFGRSIFLARTPAIMERGTVRRIACHRVPVFIRHRPITRHASGSQSTDQSRARASRPHWETCGDVSGTSRAAPGARRSIVTTPCDRARQRIESGAGDGSETLGRGWPVGLRCDRHARVMSLGDAARMDWQGVDALRSYAPGSLPARVVFGRRMASLVAPSLSAES
jgi:hypothetical protein